MTQSLVLFDLDHTLLTCDSDVEWSKYLYDKNYADRESEKKRNKYFLDYQQGTLDLDEYLEFQLGLLAKFSIGQLQEMHQEFMKEYIIPNIAPEAYELVERHQKNKDEIILVSATNEFIITPIAHHFGIQEVIGIILETDEKGNYTGHYVGVPSYREGKITRVEKWLVEHSKTWNDYARTYFYSDSLNDLPLLRLVSHPVAVNPDDFLKKEAKQAGWPILYIQLSKK